MGNCALRESFVQKQIYSAVISSLLKRCDVHYVSLMYCVNFCSKVCCCCCNLSNVSGRRFIVPMTHISKVRQCLWDGDDYIHSCRELHNKQSE